jgi:hypothetical protein
VNLIPRPLGRRVLVSVVACAVTVAPLTCRTTHRRTADDIPPSPAAVALPANAAHDAPAPSGSAPVTAVQPRARGPRRTIRNAVVACCVSLAGGSAGCAAFGGPVLIIFGFLAVIVVGVMGAAAAVALSAMLGRRDPRSPFDRLMLILCVIRGRSPGTYLPPARDGQDAAGAPDRSSGPAE